MDFVILWPSRASIERLVFLTHQFATGEFPQYFVIQRLMFFVLQGALQGFLGDDQLFAIHQHLAVCHIWINRQHQVGWQCPWRGRPGEDRYRISSLNKCFNRLLGHTRHMMAQQLFWRTCGKACTLMQF